MFEPKIPATGAIAGFVLSLLTGLVSGAGFPLVLLRAFAMAALFGALAFLAAYLLKAFLPELFMSGPDAAEPMSADRGGDFGSVVNLTVGDSDAMPFEVRPDSDGSLPDFMRSPEDDLTGVSGFADLGDSGPDAKAASRGNADPGLTGRGSAGALGSAAEAPLPVGRMNPEERSAKAPKGVGGLDSLPDLQDFIPDIATEDAEEVDSVSEPGPVQGRRESPFTATDMPGAGIESDTMARAIRTILSRDS